LRHLWIGLLLSSLNSCVFPLYASSLPQLLSPRFQLQEVKAQALQTPLTPPPFKPSESVFPGQKGLGDGGTPFQKATTPGGKAFGVYNRDPRPDIGSWLNTRDEMTAPIVLQGLQARHVIGLSLPDENTLLISGRKTHQGVHQHLLEEIRLKPVIQHRLITDQAFYNHAQWIRPEGGSMLLYRSKRIWTGINQESAAHSWLRFYDGQQPGEDILKLPRAAGVILAAGWQDAQHFAFVSAPDQQRKNAEKQRFWLLKRQTGADQASD